jgi:small subunit ribosomal protein S4
MARYTGPMTKKSRRLGVDLVGGDAAFEKRPYAPGQHGRGRIKESEYLLQLREKQKARFTYGVLEKQFLQLLECRLDNVVYRAGFARTRRAARQLVVHGHFLVNGHKVDIPSFQVSAHDIIDVREKSLEMTPFIVARETHGERVVPAWLEAIPSRMRILVHQLPVRAQIDLPVQEQLIVEYYSKK